MTESDQQIHEMPDRDLLIKTATNTENLCKIFTDFKQDNTDEHKTIFALFEKRVPNWVFYPIIIIIVGALMSLSGFAVSIKSDVIKNNVCVEKVEKRLDASPW